jgi:MFS family permease
MKLSVIGLCLIILGWVVSSYAPSYIVFVLSYGVLIGTGVGIVYGIPIKGIQTLYPERSGFYTGLILLGFGLSTLVVAPLSAYLIGQMGIYTTFRMFGLAYVLMLIPLIYGMRLPLDI